MDRGKWEEPLDCGRRGGDTKGASVGLAVRYRVQLSPTPRDRRLDVFVFLLDADHTSDMGGKADESSAVEMMLRTARLDQRDAIVMTIEFSAASGHDPDFWCVGDELGSLFIRELLPFVRETLRVGRDRGRCVVYGEARMATLALILTAVVPDVVEHVIARNPVPCPQPTVLGERLRNGSPRVLLVLDGNDDSIATAGRLAGELRRHGALVTTVLSDMSTDVEADQLAGFVFGQRGGATTHRHRRAG